MMVLNKMDDALVVVDLQQGFDDPSMGKRNNSSCADNAALLVAYWRNAGAPVVFVRHDSLAPGSTLASGAPGNKLMQELTGEPDLLVIKNVHSAFSGEPDLDRWLRAARVTSITLCGITSDHCCSTTARAAYDLGYAVHFVLDATSTFPRRAPSGRLLSADEVAEATAASLDGEFATVTSTAAVIST